MPDERLITEIENMLAEIIALGGANEITTIVPNVVIVDANPTGLTNFCIITDPRDGDNVPAKKVPGVIYSNSDLVNVLFIEGTEPIAFQQGSGSSNSGIWEIVAGTSTDIYYDKGNVGVGTATPGEQLDVAGNIALDQDIIHRGDTDTKISLTDDKISFDAGALNLLALTETAQDLVEIGDVAGGGDVDINVNSGQMFIEGATGDAKFGSTTVGTGENVIFQGQSGTQAAVGFYTGDGDGTDNNTFAVYLVGTPGSISPRERLLMQGLAGNQFRLRSDAGGGGTVRPLVLETGSNTSQLHLAIDGNVGINGVSSPSTELDIGAGAIEFEEMTAPGAGAVNTARLYAVDNGAGKTQLIVIFNTGAAQVLATQP